MKRIGNEIFWMLGALLVFSWCIGFLHGQQGIKKEEKSSADVPVGKVEKKIKKTSYSFLDPLLASRSIDKVVEALSAQPNGHSLEIVSDILNDKIVYREDELELIGACAHHVASDRKVQEGFFELIAKTPRLYQFAKGQEPCANIIARSGFASILPTLDAWVQSRPELRSKMGNFIPEALNYAAAHDNVNILQAMVQGGINISSQRATELLFILVSSKKNKGKSLVFLKEKGADVNALDEKKWTPLFYAVNNNNIPLVNALLAQGADVNVMPSPQIGTPLQLSIKKAYLAVENVLREHGARD